MEPVKSSGFRVNCLCMQGRSLVGQSEGGRASRGQSEGGAGSMGQNSAPSREGGRCSVGQGEGGRGPYRTRTDSGSFALFDRASLSRCPSRQKELVLDTAAGAAMVEAGGGGWRQVAVRSWWLGGGRFVCLPVCCLARVGEPRGDL